MADFARSYCRLGADQGNVTSRVMFGAMATLAAWWCWAVFAQISLYAVSTEARVELDGATYPLGSPFPVQRTFLGSSGPDATVPRT